MKFDIIYKITSYVFYKFSIIFINLSTRKYSVKFETHSNQIYKVLLN